MQRALEILGLDESASASAVRKAYAKLIKRCDPSTEAERFQQIREAYEWALKWAEKPEKSELALLSSKQSVRNKEAFLENNKSDGLAGALNGSIAFDDGTAAAQIVFREFTDAACDQGELCISDLLATYANDIRLTSLHAKSSFEQLILCHVFSQPTDISLLDAAIELFAWETFNQHLSAVRPDLSHRMQRHQHLQHTLKTLATRDRAELERAVRMFEIVRKKPSTRIELWHIANFNSLLERYSAFRNELDERFGKEALDWWRGKLTTGRNLLTAHQESRAGERVVGKVMRRTQHLQKTRSKLRRIWPILLIPIIALLVMWIYTHKYP